MIFIDKRTGSKELAGLIEDSLLVNIEFGDCFFEGNGPDGTVEIGVERKRIGDLVNSITTGRLSGHQLPGLLDSYYRAYLIVEGVWAGDREDDELKVQVYRNRWNPLNRGKRKFRAGDVWTYLTTLEMTGIVVRCTYDMRHTCQMVEYLARWWGKPWESHRGHDVVYKAGPPTALLSVGKPSFELKIASDLPHVGWRRAKAVVERFRTVEDMVIAEEHEWAEVEGLGKISARDIYKYIHAGGEK